MGASVHHDDAVAGAEEKFGVADHADAVVGNAVEEQDPVSVGIRRLDFPAMKVDAVRGADIEVLAVAATVGEGGIRFADEVWSELAPDGMEEAWRDQPAGDPSQDRG